MRQFLRTSLACLILSLCACGGGGGSAAPATTAEGDYVNVSDGSELYVLDDGTFYLVNLTIPGNGAYYVYGTGESTNTAFTGVGTEFIFAGDVYKNNAEVSGSYVYQSSVSLTLTSSNSSVTRAFSGKFISGFFQPASQADITGTFSNQSQPAMTIDGSGNLIINNSLIAPCTISGTIHPHGRINIYDATLNFPNSPPCAESRKWGVAILKNGSLLLLTTDGYFLSLAKS